MVLLDQRTVGRVGSRVVDQDVHAAEALEREVDAPSRGLLIDRVSADAHRPLTHLSGGGVGGLLLARGEHHVGARAGETLCDGQPDTP